MSNNEKHQLHSKVGEQLEEVFLFPYKVLLDPACGGDQHISLFINKKNRENIMCKIDAAIVNDNKINAIIEVEESGISPTKIFGKFYTSYFSSIYIRYVEEYNYSEKIGYFQLIDVSKTNEERSSKERQLKYIENEINKFINDNENSKIKSYTLLCYRNNSDIKKFVSIIEKYCKEINLTTASTL